MSQTSNLTLYFIMVFGIIMLPGMDMAFVLATTIRGGRRSGFAAVAGIMAGGVCHVVMGALGLAMLLQTMPAAFNAVLLIGAVYIAWIGWSLLRTSGGFGALKIGGGEAAMQTSFRQGMVTSLLNPKAYIFMLAVFPQFIRPEFGPVSVQALELGIITALTQGAVYGGFALVADGARTWLEGDSASQVLMARIVGVVLIGTALVTGLQGWRHF